MSTEKQDKSKKLEWLKTLTKNDQILALRPGKEPSNVDFDKDDLTTANVEQVHSDHIIISYPEYDGDFWNRKISFNNDESASFVRPIPIINNIDDEEEEDEDMTNLSQSSQSSSGSGPVKPENVIPFGGNGGNGINGGENKNNQDNMKNGESHVSFTIMPNKRKRRLHKSRENMLLLSPKSPKSPKSPERTPECADNTFFNKLHGMRQKSATPKMKQTYARTNGSKNGRNRVLKLNSTKKLGNEIKEEQSKSYQTRLKQKREKEKEEKDDKEEEENDNKNDSDQENKGPMTRSRLHEIKTRQIINNHCKNRPNWMIKNECLYRPIGLNNLGNTCFMNSTLQSLIHCTELRKFFLNNDTNHWFSKQLNISNPIGHGGKVAMNFAKLIYESCEQSQDSSGLSSSSSYYYGDSVSPRYIHWNLDGTLRQFADYRQHDAQEFMTNFLDALHEDLNRIKKKEYIEIPDFDKYEKSEETKRDYLNKRWHGIYLKRNNSICTDLFAGLLKSTVTCPKCKFTAITFDPFMHLLVPLKAPKSMEISMRRSLFNGYKRFNQNHNTSNNRRRFQASDDNDDDDDDDDIYDINDNQEEYNEISIKLLPKDTNQAPIQFSLKIKKEICDNNDWILLQAAIYDYIMDNIKYYKQSKEEINKDSDECIEKMIKSGEFESHYIYFGKQHVTNAKAFNEAEMKIPKCMEGQTNGIEIPLFQLFELHQNDKILQLIEICKQHYNHKISEYLNGTGTKRLVIHQMPSHWTDINKKEIENEQKIKCYLVFKKPNQHKNNNDDNDDENDDVTIKDIDGITSNSKKENENPYEPFNYPRFIFDKGLTSKLDENAAQNYLKKRAIEMIKSIAGNNISEKEFKQEIQVRYCRTNKEYSLDTIDSWPIITNKSNSDNNSSSKSKPIKTMVIIFSFKMHQIYTNYQREEEKKLMEKAERIKRYQQSKNNGKKRTHQAMNGGNSAYDDSNNDNPRKRQRLSPENSNNNDDNNNNNYHNNSNNRNNRNNNNNNNHMNNMNNIRDTSLPLDFQPKNIKASTIKECFGLFLSREQLGKDNKWYCKKCKQHVQGRKKLDLWWLPSYLIIAIKRFDNHGLRKYSDFVKYPINGLDLTDIIRGNDSLDIYNNNKKSKKNKNEKFIYDLYAVINHSGSLNFGHYTATIKFNKKWYNISDSSVSSGANPISQSAYILCYKRR